VVPGEASLLSVAPATQSHLCGTWVDAGLVGSSKCTTIASCSCWKGESTQFAADGTYTTFTSFGPSSSTCSPTSSTAFLSYTRVGRYELSNGTYASNFTNIKYITDRYVVNPLKDNRNPPYYIGNDTSTPLCDKSVITLLNDPVVGCPCNGTWATGEARNVSFSGAGGCSSVTCPLVSYFSPDPIYGNLWLYNQTELTTTYRNFTLPGRLGLVLTSTSTDRTTGYTATDFNYVLVNTGADCAASINAVSSSTGVALSSSASSQVGSAILISPLLTSYLLSLSLIAAAVRTSF